jgi:DNA-binding response OmpR family regulator
MVKTNNVVPTEGTDSVTIRDRKDTPKRILVVDDEVNIRHLNAEVLKRSGYEVDTAEDGAAGWEALMANGYDLLITDHDMPKLSGVDLLNKLHGARMTLPVIMASGKLPAQDLTRSPWPQLAATLLKPYTIDELVGTIREILRMNDRKQEANVN